MRKYVLLFPACLAFHVAGTWSLPLIDRDEPRFAEASREMLQRGDYVVPYFNNQPRFDKPPLTYWCQVGSFRVFGQNDFAARLPTAIAAALVAVLLLEWGTRLRDERAGWWAAIVFTLALQTFVHGKAAVADMWLVLFVTLAHWSGYELLRDCLTNDDKRSTFNVQRSTFNWNWWMFYLALGFAFIVMVVGRPVSEGETTTTIGYVEKDSPAEKIGLRPGDRILAVDGRPVTKFGGMGDSVTWRIVRSEGNTVPIQVIRDGKVLNFEPAPARDETKFWQRKSLRQVKIAPAQSSIVAEVTPNSPAASVGLKRGDQVLEVNGTKLYHFSGLSEYIEEHPNQKLTLKIERNGKQSEVTLTPEKPIAPKRPTVSTLVLLPTNGDPDSTVDEDGHILPSCRCHFFSFMYGPQ